VPLTIVPPDGTGIVAGEHSYGMSAPVGSSELQAVPFGGVGLHMPTPDDEPLLLDDPPELPLLPPDDPPEPPLLLPDELPEPPPLPPDDPPEPPPLPPDDPPPSLVPPPVRTLEAPEHAGVKAKAASEMKTAVRIAAAA
jgi:hypothetical protein